VSAALEDLKASESGSAEWEVRLERAAAAARSEALVVGSVGEVGGGEDMVVALGLGGSRFGYEGL